MAMLVFVKSLVVLAAAATVLWSSTAANAPRPRLARGKRAPR